MGSVIVIQQKLQNLFDALSEIVPLESIHEHPFDLFHGRIRKIEEAIELQIEVSKDDRRRVEKEIEEIMLKIAEIHGNIMGEMLEKDDNFTSSVVDNAVNGNSRNVPNMLRSNGLENDMEIQDTLFILKKSEDFRNIFIYKNYLLERLAQIKIEYDRLKNEIEMTIQGINGLIGLLYGNCSINKERLDVSVKDRCENDFIQNLDHATAGAMERKSAVGDFLTSDNISRNRLVLLRKYQDFLQAEVNKKESLRQDIYDKIKAMKRKLKIKIEFSKEETIYELGEIYQNVLKEYLRNKNQYKLILKSIAEKECLLEGFVQKKDFEREYSTKYITLMDEYLRYLDNLQAEKFDEIYEQVENRLREVLNTFNITEFNADFGDKKILDHQNTVNARCCFENSSRTIQNLENMRRMINYLEPKKNIYLEISGQIQSRHELLEKMMDFEKIASDPKRLFKSSFQLITEEKFRKTAYPSLLRIESKLFEDIERYESEFKEEFFYNGHILKVQLRREIENRIINKSVFINRCGDTPVRKRYKQ